MFTARCFDSSLPNLIQIFIFIIIYKNYNNNNKKTVIHFFV